MNRQPFTAAEDAIILEHAQAGTAPMLALMPHRTAGSIQNRATRIGVKVGTRPERKASATISAHLRAEILRQCRFHANDRTIAAYVDCDVATVAKVRSQAAKPQPLPNRPPLGEAPNPDRPRIITASAALRDRILAYEDAIAKRHRVSLGEARAIAIYGAPAIARFSNTTSTKGQDHA